MRPVVLTMLGYYWPGHEATGPNQSFNSLVAALGDEFDFKVVARDRTLDANEPRLPTGRWIETGTHSLRYTPGGPLGFRQLAAIQRQTPHDLMVLNGFFDHEFTIPALVARRYGLAPRRPAILSPRGEFSAGTAALAKPHKRAYLVACRALGLLDGVVMHATSEGEVEDIRRHCSWASRVVMAPNIRSLGPAVASRDHAAEAGKPVRLVFLSRIDRKKNLHYALDVLASSQQPVSFDIYGPVSDAAYWRACRQQIERLPAHVTVTYKGAIPNAEVAGTLATYDAFLLPTEGENFGHAIVDALVAGLPVIISDQTPWTDLERHGAGWSLPLAEPAAFGAAIARLAAMSPPERVALSQGARRLMEKSLADSDAVNLSRQMLREAIAAGAGR